MRALLVSTLTATAMATSAPPCMGIDATTMSAANMENLPTGMTGHCFDMPTSVRGAAQTNRCYFRYVSPTVTSDAPIIVSLHGGGSCAEYRWMYDQSMAFASITNINAIVIYPQATAMTLTGAESLGAFTSWNAGGGCCGQQAVDDVKDVEFIRQAISNVVSAFSTSNTSTGDAVSEGVTLDTRRIYLTGHSMGCALAQRFLAAGNGDIIAGMSCTSNILWDAWTAPNGTTPTLLIQGGRDTDIPYDGRDASDFRNAATYAGAAPTPASAPAAPAGLFWGDGYPYVQQSFLGNIAYLAEQFGCTNTTSAGEPYQPSWLNQALTAQGRWAPADFGTVPVSIPYYATGCPSWSATYATGSVVLLRLDECGHEAYLDMPVTTPGDIAAGVEPCTVDTAAIQFGFLTSKGGLQSPPPYWAFEAPMIETQYNLPAGGCGGGCIGGIIGGCFVPTLLFILWMGGAFAPKCPSPCAARTKKDAGDVTMTSIETEAGSA